MNKAIVISDTKFGNTEKIANLLARGMEKQGAKVDCLRFVVSCRVVCICHNGKEDRK